MGRLRMLITASALSAGFALSTSYSWSQPAKQLQGAWTVVSVDTTGPDGKKTQPFGNEPVGLLMFDGERYSLQICSAKRPKFAGNSRMQGTPEENKAAVTGCNPHWGQYTVSDGAIVFKIEHAMYANREGTEQKRS